MPPRVMQKEQKQRLNPVNSLYRISRLVSDTEDPLKALEIIIDEVVAALNPASASISLFNPDTRQLEIEVSRGLPKDSSKFALEPGRGVTGWVLLHGKPALVPDVREDGRYFPLKKSILSELAVPMDDHGNVIGVVNVDSSQIAAFDEQDLKLLTILTREATRVVNRLWLINQLKRRNRQMSTLLHMSESLVSNLDLEALLDRITRETLEVVDARVCALFLFDHDRQILTLKSMAGTTGPFDYHENLAVTESAIGTSIIHRKQIEVSDLPRVEEHHFVPVARREGLVSLLASPVAYDHHVMGVLNVYTDSPHRFSNNEKDLLSLLASLSAVAIRNARLYTRLVDHEEAHRKIERLSTLGLLAAEIAHEIRNPLTVIRLLFESLELKFDLVDPRNQDVSIIAEKLDELENIVSRVLQFGKSDHDSTAPVDLDSLVRDTALLVRLKLAQKKIGFTHNPHREPLVVRGNRAQLQQVLLNLIINASDATPPNGSITIDTGRDFVNDQPYAYAKIRDTGSGIPDDIRDHIFATFLSGRVEGTGLGMAIVKRILHAHKGQIEILDTSKAGTTMKLRLPLL